MEIINVTDFNYEIWREFSPVKRKHVNRHNKNKPTFLEAICAFDIETSYLKDYDQNFMYIWQFQIGHKCCVIGRYWEDFLDFLRNSLTFLPDNCNVFILDHNLSYEFGYLRGVYPFRNDEVFAIDSRKVLRCMMYDRFEFRCSYLQTNMSLHDFTYKMDVEHKKLPDYDYSEVRYPWTELSPEELAYCVNDVCGLVEAFEREMSMDGDDVYTVPLTSTGYVRRDVKKAMASAKRNPAKWMPMDLDLYHAMKLAFRGGNTHASRFHARDIVKNVYSADRSSSYPEVLINHNYPVAKFERFEHHPILPDRLDYTVYSRKRPVLAHIALYGCRLRNEYEPVPYIARSNVERLVDGQNTCYGNNDNGRMLKFEYGELYLTDIDYKIIKEQYVWDSIEIFDMWVSRYGLLPRAFTDVIKEYYRKKTSLKNVPGAENEYFRAKQKLNSIYGFCATDPVRIPLEIDPETNDLAPRTMLQCIDTGETDGSGKPIKREMTNEEIRQLESDLLIKNERTKFVDYSTAVWCTAWARYELQEGIKQTPWWSFVYVDTDSVKYTEPIDWSTYNEWKIKCSTATGAYADDPQGVRHYMGVFEAENGGKPYALFRSYGAKKYCCVTGDGKLELTCAGVGKKAGAEELEEAAARLGCRGIDLFKEGFVFRKAGGVQAIYNDKVDRWIIVDGHALHITDNIVLKDSSYTLDITNSYKTVIFLSKRMFAKILHL